MTIGDFQALNRLFGTIVAEHLGGAFPQPAEIETLGTSPPSPHQVSGPARRWIALLDLCLHPQLFRMGIKKQSPDEETLTAAIRYLAAKKPRSEVDRDRLDWLLTYVFRRRAETGSTVGFGAVRENIQRWLADSAQAPLTDAAQNLLSEVAAAVADVTDMRTFSQLTESGLIQRGRDIKESFQEEFFHPEVLPALVNYNLVFGRRFEALFERAAAQVRGASAGLAEKDYRSTAGDFRKLSSLTKEAGGDVPQEAARPAESAWRVGRPMPSVPPSGPPASQPPAPPPAAALPQDPLERMKSLGIDLSRQESKLKMLQNNIAGFARSAGRAVDTIPLPHGSFPVAEWESAALTGEYGPEDRSFRAEFSNQVRAALGLIAAMREELASYQEKRSSEFLWKAHYDSLIYLLYQAGLQAAKLEEAARDARRRGLIEKAVQLVRTAEKLRQQMEPVAALF